MAEFDTFFSIPSGSMARIEDREERQRYLDAFNALPKELMAVVNDAKIGAWLRGVATANNLPVEQSADIARVVLEVVCGMIRPDEMAKALSERLKVDRALGARISGEIEKELLAPVALELNQFLQGKAGETGNDKQEKDDLAL